MAIRFKGTQEAHGYLSSFYCAPMWLKGKRWVTTEHYVQAQKFAGTHHEEEIRNAPTPQQAVQMGRDRRRSLRPDWEVVREDVMREAAFAKFSQHAALTQLLLATGKEELVAVSPDDYDRDEGAGSEAGNLLGKILMDTRIELSERRRESA